jgi:AcrR family transcriptional regulator
MARPRETDKRRGLAERAAAVLEASGLSISAEQLARELGINRTTLLYHFPSYAQIIQSVLGDLLTAQGAFVEERVGRHAHPIDRLYARVCAIHEFQRGKERRILFLSQAVAVTGGPHVAEIVRSAAELFAPDRRALVEGIERGIKEGTVEPCDAEALVALVRSTIDGLTLQRVTSDVPLEPVHRFLWEKVLAPLKREPPPDASRRARSKIAAEAATPATNTKKR